MWSNKLIGTKTASHLSAQTLTYLMKVIIAVRLASSLTCFILVKASESKMAKPETSHNTNVKQKSKSHFCPKLAEFLD